MKNEGWHLRLNCSNGTICHVQRHWNLSNILAKKVRWGDGAAPHPALKVDNCMQWGCQPYCMQKDHWACVCVCETQWSSTLGDANFNESIGYIISSTFPLSCITKSQYFLNYSFRKQVIISVVFFFFGQYSELKGALWRLTKSGWIRDTTIFVWIELRIHKAIFWVGENGLVFQALLQTWLGTSPKSLFLPSDTSELFSHKKLFSFVSLIRNSLSVNSLNEKNTQYSTL